ncbi:LysR family transcriptional regulator [Mixta theicola]|uniref:LysR family transcriptional regulator n=1 Tax=Mixta theicola TaxID=1458355 RepID=A0A2K1Q576_9GAMM|nr:LysR family transcriptional regulator [Mixta theicola]PNS10184.1 LysR family transcriptional regulator [Mixta theicola]GLR08486.1 LysR family transcriptional regulator [Mixta theicola]
MDTQLLRAFLILAETGNYHEAAKKLFITQPALTKKIQALEYQLDLPLFMRGRHGSQLTPAGKQLMPHAQAVMKQVEELRQHARNVSSGKAGSLAIGFGISSIRIAPELVAHFRRRYPQINVSLEDISSTQQADGLYAGSLQLAFMRLPVAPPLSSLRLITEKLAIAVATKEKADLVSKLHHEGDYRLLVDFPMIQLTPERGPGLKQQISRFLAFNHVDANIIQRSRDIQTLLALVATGIGIALITESAVNIAPRGIEFIPLSGPYASWEVGLVWNPAWADPIRDRFIEVVKRYKPSER